MGFSVFKDHSGSIVCDIRGHTDTCNYIAAHCDGYFNIAKYYYCSPHASSSLFTALFCFGIFLALVALFGCLSLIVASLFFPNVNYFTNACGWNNRIMSVMLLPLTNAIPDVVSYYVTLRSNSLDLVLGQLIGSIMVMFTVIIGSISFFCPFTVTDSRWVMRDFAWVVAVLVLFLYILSDGKITTAECAVMVLLFGVYIFYLSRYDQLAAAQKVDREYARELARLPLPSLPSLPILQNLPNLANLNLPHPSLTLLPSLPLLERPVLPLSLKSGTSVGSDGPVFDEVVEILENRDTHRHFLIWMFHRIIDLVEKLLAMVVPVVLEEENTSTPGLRMWFSAVVPLVTNYEFGLTDWQNMVPVILAAILVTEAAYQHARLRKVAVSLVGVYMSMVVLSQISQTVLRLVKNLGVLLKISDYMLGLVVFSITNSITDIITNITISVTVDPIYGVNCLLGSPIILILLGTGVNGLLVHAAGQTLKFQVHENLIVSASGVLLLMLFYLAYIPLNKWNLDRKLGVVVWLWAVAVTALNCVLDQ